VALQINHERSWKLKEIAQQARQARKIDAWIYYCTLCDEVLVIARRFMEVKGVQAAFDDVCPDCGFSLEDVIYCEQTKVPEASATYVDPKSPKATLLFELPPRATDAVKVQTAGFHTEERILTTGIDKLDDLIRLTTGQFVVFQGYPFSSSLGELLCVRAQLDHPIGLNSASVYIDGGNRFNAYAVSHHAIENRIEPELALSRIHASRAFTYFQLASLLNEKLPSALVQFHSRLAVISSITDLFQDPEIKDTQEAHRIFQRVSRSLVAIAENTSALVIATNFQSTNSIAAVLAQTAHTIISAERHDAFTRFALTRNRLWPNRKITIREDQPDQFLEYYMGK
jgi:hypothetical protein